MIGFLSGRTTGESTTMLPLAIALSVCVAQPAHAGTLTEESRLLQQVAIEQKPGSQVSAELSLRDETGAAVRLGDYFNDKPIILHLVYLECPMLCNLTADGLVRTLKTLELDVGDEFTVLTVSFDHRETPRLAAAAKRTALKRYGRDGAGAGWHFLTGEQSALRDLTDSVGFRYAWNADLGQYAHGAGIIFLTPEGRVSRYLNGVEFPARDVRLALVESSQNQIGSIVDQALLLCYPYDPHTGRYGLAIHRLLQAAGLTTLGVLVTSVLVMLRRERRRNSHSAGLHQLAP